MSSIALRQEIISTVSDFNNSGLSVGTSGNLSVRYDEHFLITPTGIAYEQLIPDDIVLCDLDGNVVAGNLKPSSEWPLHAAIYKERDDAQAIVHAHPPYATGLACTHKPIPAFNYMIAIAGGNSIRCADYATIGSQQLGQSIGQSPSLAFPEHTTLTKMTCCWKSADVEGRYQQDSCLMVMHFVGQEQL